LTRLFPERPVNKMIRSFVWLGMKADMQLSKNMIKKQRKKLKIKVKMH
jgi:hypothetical protein